MDTLLDQVHPIQRDDRVARCSRVVRMVSIDQSLQCSGRRMIGGDASDGRYAG